MLAWAYLGRSKWELATALDEGSVEDEGEGEGSDRASNSSASSDLAESADEEVDASASVLASDEVGSADCATPSRSSRNLGVEADGAWRKGMTR